MEEENKSEAPVGKEVSSRGSTHFACVKDCALFSFASLLLVLLPALREREREREFDASTDSFQHVRIFLESPLYSQ